LPAAAATGSRFLATGSILQLGFEDGDLRRMDSLYASGQIEMEGNATRFIDRKTYQNGKVVHTQILS
jgi:hypothetical protein